MKRSKLFLLCLMAMDVWAFPDHNTLVKQERILGGADATGAEFVVLIKPTNHEDQEMPICGGALINSTLVLTTASCLYHAVKATVYAGNYDPAGLPIQSKEAISINLHGEFYRNGLINDIAIIRLKHPGIDITSTDAIAKTIELAKPSVTKGDALVKSKNPITIYGWGYTVKEGPDAAKLKMTTVQPIASKDCQKLLNPDYYQLPPSSYCISNTVICTHDFGGPVVMFDTKLGKQFLVGFASNTIGCPSIYPNIISRIDTAAPWIQANGGPWLK